MSDAAPITLRPIGVVHTEHQDAGTTPIHARLNPAGIGRAVIDQAFVAGLEGLDDMAYAWLVTYLHEPVRAEPGADPLRPVPFLATAHEQVGVFATRYPVRPNPIGLSLIEVIRVDGATLTFRGVDLLDGTPILDLKPWVPTFDLPTPIATVAAEVAAGIRTGWYESSRLGAQTGAAPTTELTPDGLEPPG